MARDAAFMGTRLLRDELGVLQADVVSFRDARGAERRLRDGSGATAICAQGLRQPIADSRDACRSVFANSGMRTSNSR